MSGRRADTGALATNNVPADHVTDPQHVCSECHVDQRMESKQLLQQAEQTLYDILLGPVEMTDFNK
eukprot:gene827-21722_t